MARLSFLALTALCAVTQAWLPDNQLLDKRGFSLFERNVTRRSGEADVERRWMPPTHKIRGVNLGSLFIVEPWMMGDSWKAMGCEGMDSEFDCVKKTGRERSNAAWAKHWDSWITEGELDEMLSYDINTIRIPIGYWMKEDLVDMASEYFPKGGFDYLKRLCGWASNKGFYIILDLHGAPGAQTPKNSFTGQFNPGVGFYGDYNYNRAIQFLEWITRIAHTTYEFRNVGMLELVNEPLTWSQAVPSLRSTYYRNAYDAIRKVETGLADTVNNYLHIQMMGTGWGSGDPTEFLSNNYFTAFDDHRYLKWDDRVEVSWESYVATSCGDNRAADHAGPTIVGEWSISPPDDVQWTDGWRPDVEANKKFYSRWFAAQVQAYEKWTAGWVFWSWKTELGSDYRWSYRDAVKAGVIPHDLDTMPSAC